MICTKTAQKMMVVGVFSARAVVILLLTVSVGYGTCLSLEQGRRQVSCSRDGEE